MPNIKDLMPSISEVIPLTYDQSKDDGFEQLIQDFLQKAPKSSITPKFVHMLGIPASGKSTFYKNNQEKFKDYIFVDFDAMMQAHPQYQKDVLTYGSAEAFRRWELPARMAGYELLHRAVQARKNVFLDHGASPQCHQELLRNVKKMYGYKTQMYYLPCTAKVAIERARQREELTKRHTPVELITNRIKLVEKNKNIYQQIVDEFVTVKNI